MRTPRFTVGRDHTNVGKLDQVDDSDSPGHAAKLELRQLLQDCVTAQDKPPPHKSYESSSSAKDESDIYESSPSAKDGSDITSQAIYKGWE